MVVALLVSLASLLTIACGKPVARGGLVLHESRQSIPSGFTHVGAAPSDTVLNLRMALVPNDVAALQKALMDVSTPSSANYGNHLSKSQVEAFVRPSSESTQAVTTFLSTNGIKASTVSPAGDWMKFSVPISLANAMFGTQFSIFKHTASGKEYIRTMNYSIPESLQGHINLVHPTVTFSRPNIRLPVITAPMPSKKRGLSNITGALLPCDEAVTPSCLQDLYGIPTTAATEDSNNLLVTGYIEQYAQESDLMEFLTLTRSDIDPSTTFTLETLDSGTNPQDPLQAGVEANLDVQYTIGVATGVPVTFLSVGEDVNDGDLSGFLDTINFLLAEDSPPQVMTTSYGANEADISRALAEQLCNAYAQLGARGTSILFASGDGGVAGSQSADCTDFVPTFPSGCPFMTSVGATTGTGPETAADFSSGGFSNYFDVPDYQASAVSAYLSTLGDTNAGLFNASGRGFPDVSAQGEDFEIVTGATPELVSGTSCSSPTFASVISLLNDELVAAGKSPLGFLNPFLYSTGASALNDVTSGDNPGCNTNGFTAVSGWDPVTGLGTPNYAKLRTAAGLS